MNITRLAFSLSLASLCVGAVGSCDGTDTGNPFVQPLVVDVHSSDPNDVAIQEDLGGTIVTEAWLSLDQLNFSECEINSNVVVPPIGVADHAAADSLHLDIEMTEASYCSITVPWSLAASGDGVPDDVVGSSIYLAGTTASGTPFVLRSTSTTSTTASATANQFVLAAELGGLFLGFDLATWLDGVDLDSVAANGDGMIVIDSSTNSGLLTVFESNLSAGVELYRDENNNGQLDGPEDELLAKGN